MSEERPVRQSEEKGEKEEEKEEEKHEKSWDEKWRRDPLSAAVWAVIIIWAGLVLLASSLGIFNWIPFVDAWPFFFLGAGGILILEAVFRLLVPTYRGPVMGNVILALVFLGIGLGGLIGWSVIWAFVIIGIGVFLLFSGLFRRRE